MVQRNQTRHAVSITKGGLVGLSDGDIEIIRALGTFQSLVLPGEESPVSIHNLYPSFEDGIRNVTKYSRVFNKVLKLNLAKLKTFSFLPLKR